MITPYEILDRAITDCINYYGGDSMQQPFVRILTEAQLKARKVKYNHENLPQ